MTATTEWQLRDLPSGETVEAFAAACRLPRELAAIVLQRTASPEAARDFLTPLDGAQSDPFTIPEMAEAVDRILRAVRDREPITVFGDYDADGVTGTVLLVQALKTLGAVVKPFFPNRESEGYGLTPASVSRCLTFEPKPKLLITVDCGITSTEEVDRLIAQGVEVIVTDHHALPGKLPAALACINPRRLPAGSPAEGLCGCATAYMVVRALEARGAAVVADDYLDLVAVATISDVMELKAENRILVARGLRNLSDRLAASPARGNAGLLALVRRLNIRSDEMSSERIAFSVSPCINAASRMGEEEFKEAYKLLGLSRSEAANSLVAINDRRKACERELFLRIKTEFRQQLSSGKPVAVGGENYHAGVIGIVSARLMEELQTPVAVISKDADGGGHGSMRTCGGHDAVEALRKLEDLLDHYGGHAKAAGFTLKPGTFDAFCIRFPSAFSAADNVSPIRFVDGDLTRRTIDLDLCEALSRLEPYGNGNPKPVFRARFTVRSIKQIGGGAHAVFELEQLGCAGTPLPLKAIWFRQGPHSKRFVVGEQVQAIFTLSIDRFNPTRIRPQLQIVDLRVV